MQLGPYAHLEVVARGGMGIVARGVDPESGRVVAVKTLDVESAVLVDALVREAEVLARLHHPGVAPLLAHGVTAGIPWFAMEWIEGASLDESWGGATTYGSGATLSFFDDEPDTEEVEAMYAAEDPRGVLLVLARLARTLAWLHGEGIVHRDLKPGNIIVRDGWPVLVDFGIGVRFAASGREVAQLPPLRAGTPAFMAPEQQFGQAVDARADIFALGRLLEKGLGMACPAGLSDMVDAMLSEAIEHRPGSAEDVADRIDAWTGMDSRWPDAPQARAYLYRAPFVGRREDVERLASMLRDVGAAVVAGPPGIGRTRLAVAVARVLERSGCQVLDRLPDGSVDAVLLAVDDALASGATVVLVDDLHLNEVLRRAVSRLAAAGRPGLSVLATWSDGAGPVPSGLADYAYALKPLAPSDLSRLVEGMLGGSAQTIPEWLANRVDGNPLRAAEWLRTAVALGKLERRGHWRPAAPPAELGLGTSLEALGSARLASVGVETRRALEALAISGVLVDETRLHEAVAVGLLERREGELQFVHEPLRRAVLAATDPARARALSREAATRLEAGTADASALADLWLGAEEPRAALPWLWRAAEEAHAGGAVATAVSRLEQWLEVGGEPIESRVEARIQVVRWLLAQGRDAEAGPHARAGVKEARGCDPVLRARMRREAFGVDAACDAESTVPLLLEAYETSSTARERIEFLTMLTTTLANLGRLDEASALLDGFDCESADHEIRVLDQRGVLAFMGSRFEEAVDTWSRALGRPMGGTDAGEARRNKIRGRLASALVQDGQPEVALRELDRQVDAVAESGSREELASVHLNRCLVKVLLGDLEGAWADVERAHRLALAFADPLVVQLAVINRVFVALERGELEAAVRLAEDLEPSSSTRLDSARRLVSARVFRETGALGRAAELLAHPPFEGLWTRHLVEQGMLELARGRSARETLVRALESAAERGITPGHRSFEGLDLARLIAAQEAFEG